MAGRKVAVVGAGVAGLTLAYNLARTTPKLTLDVYERSTQPGGRMRSQLASDPNNTSKYLLDMGANLIDFETPESQAYWHKLLPQSCAGKLRPLKKPFLLYDSESGALKQGDYTKGRYFYEGGFNQLAGDLIEAIRSEVTRNQDLDVRFQFGVSADRVQLIGQEIRISYRDGEQQINEKYDELYLACPPPSILPLLQGIQQAQIQEISSFCQQFQYTKQISVAFETKSTGHDFSCILLRGHQVLTFICSHWEKYNSSAIVVQTSEKFSEANMHSSDEEIAAQVYSALPAQIKQIAMDRPLCVHRWPISLIKSAGDSPKMPQHPRVHLVGDCLLQKSRVSNAVHSAAYVQSGDKAKL